MVAGDEEQANDNSHIEDNEEEPFEVRNDHHFAILISAIWDVNKLKNSRKNDDVKQISFSYKLIISYFSNVIRIQLPRIDQKNNERINTKEYENEPKPVDVHFVVLYCIEFKSFGFAILDGFSHQASHLGFEKEHDGAEDGQVKSEHLNHHPVESLWSSRSMPIVDVTVWNVELKVKDTAHEDKDLVHQHEGLCDFAVDGLGINLNELTQDASDMAYSRDENALKERSTSLFVVVPLNRVIWDLFGVHQDQGAI